MPRCWRWGWRPPPPSACTEVDIRTGDVALFAALIDALDLYPVWRRRLMKDFNRKVSLAQDLERLTLATVDAATNMKACWRRWPAPTARRRWRWSPT